MGKRHVKKVLLVGWDGADWKVASPLMDEGRMPNLSRLAEAGVMGNLATLYPSLSPMLWTSIATGKRPFKHGVLGFTEPAPGGAGIRPISSHSRRCKALWNIFTQVGMRSTVLGWWPSHPAEPIHGLMVSNHYHHAEFKHGEPWPMRPGTVHPAELSDFYGSLRTHPQDLDVDLVMEFIPRLAEIDQEKDHRVETAARTIADCLTMCDAAEAALRNEPWEFTAVYFDSIDHFCHAFMRFHPPRLPWVDEAEFELYKDVVASGYVWHDILLGRLLKAAGPDATVLLCSDHGFHSDHLRPRTVPNEPAGPFLQHRHHGVLLASGPGIKMDERISGASILDVAPTLLHLYGLPVGKDMDGRPLTGLLRDPSAVETVPSWDAMPGRDGRLPEDASVDPLASAEAINQLVALGYIQRPDANVEKAVADTIRELRYNEARAYMDAGRHAEAADILDGLLAECPDAYRFGIQLVACLEPLGRIPRAREVLEELFRRKKVNAEAATAKLKEFMDARKEKPFDEWPEDEQNEYRQLHSESGGSLFTAEYLMGSLLAAEGDAEGALARLAVAEQANPGRPILNCKIGDVLSSLCRYGDAERNYLKSIAIDPEHVNAHLGLARVHLARGWNLRAAAAARQAVALCHHLPPGHYLLGVALTRLGRVYLAVQALDTALAQNPNFPEAHRQLARLYAGKLGDPLLAAEHRNLAAEAGVRLDALSTGAVTREVAAEAATVLASDQIPGEFESPVSVGVPTHLPDTVVVVSGLPRSGTSMMMQALAAGGLAPFTDDQRKPDDDNPAGYLEHAKSASIRTDASWVPEARGKTVKIIAQNLFFLPRPDAFSYRVILMERDIGEVLASQEAMLRRVAPGRPRPRSDMARTFADQLRRARLMLSARRISVLRVDYAAAVADPMAMAARINAFLGGSLDESAMAAAVRPSLRHHGGKA